MRLSLFAVALATAIVAANAASVPFLVRQTVPEDAIGTFRRGQFLGGVCYQAITHNATVDENLRIAHSVMDIDGVPCTGDGAMQVYLDADEALAEVDADSSKRLIGDVSAVVTDALYGVEMNGRQCGGRRFPPKTLVIIFSPETPTTIGFDTYFPSRRYMFIDDPSRAGVCRYSADRRPVAEEVSPSPAPSPSVTASIAPPEPTPQASSSPVPGAGGVIPGTGTGEASPSPSSEATLTVPAITLEDLESPSPDDDDDDDDPICFPAEATVELEDGSTKMMDQVQIGDRVRVGKDIFSEVFMFTHKVSKKVSQFVKLDLASGASISATSGHYLYLNGRLAAARTAKCGDVMELANGVRSTVEKVSAVRGTGLYNPQTVHGDIVVNGVRASTFTTAIEAGTAQAMLAPLRMVYGVLGWSTRAFDGGFDMINKVMPKGELVL